MEAFIPASSVRRHSITTSSTRSTGLSTIWRWRSRYTATAARTSASSDLLPRLSKRMQMTRKPGPALRRFSRHRAFRWFHLPSRRKAMPLEAWTALISPMCSPTWRAAPESRPARWRSSPPSSTSASRPGRPLSRSSRWTTSPTTATSCGFPSLRPRSTGSEEALSRWIFSAI